MTTSTVDAPAPATRPHPSWWTPEAERRLAILKRRQAVFDSKVYIKLLELMERNRRRCLAANYAFNDAWAKMETMYNHNIDIEGSPEAAEWERAIAEHHTAHENGHRLHAIWKRLFFSNMEPCDVEGAIGKLYEGDVLTGPYPLPLP